MYPGDPNETQVRFDLYRMPFNGGHGGAPEPIPGASGNGMSNSFPKVSPDGKWLVWTQARNGMLLRPDGRLWIMPLPRGAPRLMTCNTTLMNSWHSFSPNGRWLVFSSKVNTPYTQLLLTHIDANGQDSPAILIERTQAENRAANIPEFVNTPYDAFGEIVVPAVAHREHFYRANQLAQEGKKSEAIDELNKALEGEAKDWRTYDWKYHDKISRLLLEQGRTDDAVEHIRKSIELNPGNSAMHANLGYVLYERGNLDEARKELDTALRLSPGDARSWLNRGSIRLSQSDAAGAEADFARAAELAPDNPRAWSGKGMACWSRRDLPGARAALDRAIALDASDVTARFFRAQVRRATGDLRGALFDLDRAHELAAPGSPAAREVDTMRREAKDALAGADAEPRSN
jgi:Flp pilus assembly protein TadD